MQENPKPKSEYDGRVLDMSEQAHQLAMNFLAQIVPSASLEGLFAYGSEGTEEAVLKARRVEADLKVACFQSEGLEYHEYFRWSIELIREILFLEEALRLCIDFVDNNPSYLLREVGVILGSSIPRIGKYLRCVVMESDYAHVLELEDQDYHVSPADHSKLFLVIKKGIIDISGTLKGIIVELLDSHEVFEGQKTVLAASTSVTETALILEPEKVRLMIGGEMILAGGKVVLIRKVNQRQIYGAASALGLKPNRRTVRGMYKVIDNSVGEDVYCFVPDDCMCLPVNFITQ